MSYDNNKKAFDRTAKRILDNSRQNGKNITFQEAQSQLRNHLNKSTYKK
jgi:hypothetical protein